MSTIEESQTLLALSITTLWLAQSTPEPRARPMGTHSYRKPMRSPVEQSFPGRQRA